MPFTFSHPAIVLPLTRLKIRFMSASALAVGSITPDFEYFIKMKLSGRFSHTLPGAFAFCLPVGFALLAVFHLIVKRPLINALPSYFYARLARLRDFNFISSVREHPLLYAAYLLTGIFSHLLWDSFTHANHFMVRHIDWLSWPIALPGYGPMPLFRYLQHISTLAGAGYLIYFFHNMPAHDEKNTLHFTYWVFVLIISLVIYLLRARQGFQYLGDQVVSLISAIFISMILTGIYYGLKKNLYQKNVPNKK